MPRAVACPRDTVTQRVGCPLSVSPAGAVLFGGLSPWASSLVPRRSSRWSPNPRPEAAERTGAGSQAQRTQPEPAGQTGAGSQAQRTQPEPAGQTGAGSQAQRTQPEPAGQT